MKNLLYVLLVILLIVGFGYWFWSFGVVPLQVARYAELIIQQPGVQIKKAGSDQWETAGSNMHIEKGWAIKTDESGLATVRFYDQGESRLDRNSEMVISEATAGDTAGVGMKAEVTLSAGRVWSRVLRLLDIESSYAVRSSEVVATVRGTSFGVQKSEDGTVAVSVAESVVTVAPASEANDESKAKAVGEGSVTEFSSAGEVKQERDVTDEERSEGWHVSNELADQSFIKSIVDQRVSELKALGGVRADNPLNGIAELSERVHLALANDETKNVLLEQYLVRRLYHLVELVDAGKTGLASQELSSIENDLKAQVSAEKKGMEVNVLRASVVRISLLMDETNPSDALYPFKQRVERLFESLSSSSEISTLYTRMVALDARLDEAGRLISEKSFEDAHTSLNGVRSGVDNIRRDSSGMIATLSDEYRSAFEGKLSALKIRLMNLQARLDSAEHPMTQPGSATSTTEILPIEEMQSEIVSLRLSATPNPVDIGQSTTLMVKAIHKDGTETDVSAFSTFTSLQYVGRLNGLSYTARGIGSDEIVARYGGFETKGTVETKGEITLSDLAIVSSVGTHLYSGQRTRMSAIARYNNGETEDVTNETEFVVVSGKGTLKGTTFYNDDTFGDVTIAGTYKTASSTSIGSVTLTVEKAQ